MVLQELGLMIYDTTSPSGFESTTWAKDKLDELSKKYPEEKDFWTFGITCKSNGKVTGTE